MIKKILIVEDDVLISEHLSMILEDLNYEVIGICPSMESAIELLKFEEPDFALLDIRMNGIDEGIKVAEHLNILGIPFAFVTSFSDKKTLMDAVLQKPIGYVVKPFEEEDVIKVIENANMVLQENFLEIIKAQSVQRIAYNNILYLKSDNVYVEIYTKQKKYLVREKLSDLIERLPSSKFVRTNQSYCVNIASVKEVEGNEIQIMETKIPLSKKYRSGFFQIFRSGE